jgi:hypothetical protein
VGIGDVSIRRGVRRLLISSGQIRTGKVGNSIERLSGDIGRKASKDALEHFL